MMFELESDRRNEYSMFHWDWKYFGPASRQAVRLLLLAACLASFSCAGPQKPPGRQYPHGTRVGVFNGLGPEATHRHIGALRVNSFEKKYAVDWRLAERAGRRLQALLEADGRYTVLPVASEPLRGLSRIATGPNFYLSADFEAQMRQTAEQHRLDLLVFIDAFDGPCFYKIANQSVPFDGYGLLTRQSLASGVDKLIPLKTDEAYAVAQIRVVVFDFGPVRRVGEAVPKMSRSPLKNFRWPADIKQLKASDLEPILAPIASRTEEAVRQALRAAGLIDESAPREPSR
jgi:hypothetical protein